MRNLPIALLIVLGSVSARAQEDAAARMKAWSTALGVECSYCHVDGSWTDTSKPTYDFAKRMSNMVRGLNAGPLKDFDPIDCWTCHRGKPRPTRLPVADWQRIQADHAADFAATPERALGMSVYSASLGVDCSHCHEGRNFKATTKPAYAMVAKMGPIFDEIPKYFADSPRKPVTQCYMCHQGQIKPQRH